MITKEMVEGHAIYRKYFRYWDFLLQSYEGGIDYTGAFINNAQSQSLTDAVTITVNGSPLRSVAKGNLFMHAREKDEDYTARINMSFYYNFCAPVVDIYNNHLFKQSPVDDFKNIQTEVDKIYEDVDNMGSSLPEFRRNLAEMCQIYGHCFVIVDSPNINADNIVTFRDQIDNRAFPFLTIYPPQAVLNWSLDKFGNPYWVLLKESDDSNIDPKTYDKSNTSKNLYRLWTRKSWHLYNSGLKEIATGNHPVGKVPIVCAFDKRSKYAINFLGVSSLSDIAFVARDIYNSCSELKQILRDQTFSFLAVQGTSDEFSPLSVGTNKGLLYPEGRNVPQYISPQSQNAEVYFNHIDRQVSKIYQLAKLEGGSAEFKGQGAVEQSGVSKAWDFNETNSSLTNKSNNLEDAEQKIWKLFSLWTGEDFDGKVQYPKEFSVSKLSDDMNEAEQAAKLSLGKTFMLEEIKTIHKKKFPSATAEELEVMEAEASAELDKKTEVTAGNNLTKGIRSRMPFLFNQNANSAANGG